jgi:hypothetical protein
MKARAQAESHAANGAHAGHGDHGEVQKINVNGQILRLVIQRGNGSQLPLLLMNGIGVNLELLQPFVDALDTEREIIRFDVPGIGGSPLPATPYVFPMLAYLLTLALDQLGYKRVARWPNSLPCNTQAAAGALSWPAQRRVRPWSPLARTYLLACFLRRAIWRRATSMEPTPTRPALT